GATELLHYQLLKRIEVERGGRAVWRRRFGLQAGLADDHAVRLRGIELLRREHSAEDSERGHARGAGPHAFRAREHPLRLKNLLVLGVAGGAAALAQEPKHPLALAPRIAGREALGHGVADLQRLERAARAERARDRVRARRLRGNHPWHARDPARVAQLAEASRRRDERLADGPRR